MKENKCLSMLKGISCILVVLFHCPLPGMLGDLIIYAFRFPIPIFFLISGYYSFAKPNYLHKAQKMMVFLLEAEAIAFFASVFANWMGQAQYNPVDILRHTNWIKTIFFGSVFNSTLWYLYAMFWTWIVMYFIFRTEKSICVGYCLAIPLLLMQVIGRYYIATYYDINNYIYLFRSMLLFALPFILIGRFIADKEEQIMNLNIKFKGKILILVGCGLLVCEYLKWHQYMDFHISTLFISVGLFLYALQHPNFCMKGILAHIGKNISKYVYVLHIPIKIVIYSVAIKVMPEMIDGYGFPIVVVLSTIGISYVYIIIKQRVISM